MVLYGAETWTLRAADQKYLVSSKMWCWRRMEKISWTDHAKNKEVLLRINEQRNILHEIRKRKAKWIGHILRRNCLLKQVIEGKIKVEMELTRRRWRRRKKLLGDLTDRSGYCHLKEEVLDRTIWRHRFGGDFGPVVRQNTERMYEWMYNKKQNTHKLTFNFLPMSKSQPLATFCAFKWEQCIISSSYGRSASVSLYKHFTVTKHEHRLSRYATNTYSDNGIITTVSYETRGRLHENYMVPGSHTNSNLCAIRGVNTRHQQFEWTQCLHLQNSSLRAKFKKLKIPYTKLVPTSNDQQL